MRDSQSRARHLWGLGKQRVQGHRVMKGLNRAVIPGIVRYSGVLGVEQAENSQSNLLKLTRLIGR